VKFHKEKEYVNAVSITWGLKTLVIQFLTLRYIKSPYSPPSLISTCFFELRFFVDERQTIIV